MDAVAQLEHDKSALAVVVTRSVGLAAEARAKIVKLAADAPRCYIIKRSWSACGITIACCSAADAAAVTRLVASEHVQICTSRPLAVFRRLAPVAGGVFVGDNTAVAVGDYVAGANHTLPTAASARFGSGLSVLDFMKRTSVV